MNPTEVGHPGLRGAMNKAGGGYLGARGMQGAEQSRGLSRAGAEGDWVDRGRVSVDGRAARGSGEECREGDGK